MKRLFFLFPVFFSLALTAQVPTNIVLVESVDADPEVVIEDVCWSVGAVDSSLTRFTYLDPSDSTNTQVLFYVNASGERVTVTGGSLSLGFCGCCDGGGSVVATGVGTFVKKLSLGENYTLPLDTLMKYDHLVFLAASNASTGDTAVINFPNLLNDGTETGLGKRLFVYAYQDLADSAYNVVVTAPGGSDGTGGLNSALRKYNCLPGQLSYSNDTIRAVTDSVHRLYVYTTVPGKAYHFYYRDCQEVGSIAFDSDRPILRVPAVGDKIGGSTITEWLNWWYFSPPTISLNVSGGTLFEVGTSNVLTLSGSTSNPGGSTLSAGVLQRTSPTPVNDVNTFNASTSYSESVTFAPTQGGTADYTQLSYTFQASQDWEGGGQSGTATSPSRTIQAVYPVLYGVSSTDLHTTGSAYTTLTKLVQTEGNKTVTLDGTGFLYYAVPSTWSDTALSSILDQNGFNVTASFTSQTVSVPSSGLVNDWTINYIIYKSNNQATVTNATYTFNR